MDLQSDKLSTNRRVNPKNAGENGEGNPTVGNFSTWKLVRPESDTVSMSFSETNSMTWCPRFCSTSATAMPGKRCPPVPPHAITAFMLDYVTYRLIKFAASLWHSS